MQTNRRVLRGFDGYAPVFRNPVTHFRKRSNAVAFAESFLREREWQLDETGEEPTTDYEVARRMKLKQQHLAWAECFE